MDINKNDTIELRSEDIRDILNKTPIWMISWGSTIIILMIFFAFTFSYFIKYPDMVIGRATISVDIPPAYVISKVSGRLGLILHQNGSSVNTGDILAQVNNPIPITTIDSLDAYLKSIHEFLENSSIQEYKNLRPVQIYDATADLNALSNTLQDYDYFLFNPNSQKELRDIKGKLDAHLKLAEISRNEYELNKNEIAYATEKFKMEKEEYELGFDTRLNFLNAQSSYNQSLKMEQSIKKSLIQKELTISDLKSQIEDFILNQEELTRQYRTKIIEFITALENYIVRWRTDFTIRSPTSGQLNYLGRIKRNQLIKSGDPLFAVLSSEQSIETILYLPATGFGKVKIGQKVKIKVDNYPHKEYGYINGIVSKMASIPNQNMYQVEVKLVNGLTTSYNKQLEYSPEMAATAEVITEDLRLLERLFNSIRSILDV
ncbi:MAG: HlyD family efflux transporter periplasmic adaptor subunit [Bacteroidota bacterium]